MSANQWETVNPVSSPAGDVTLTALLVLACVLIVAVYLEVREHRIPNWLTFSGMAIGLLLGFARGMPFLRESVVGLIIGFGFLFVFYMFGGVGGGDVKLMGAVGALMGTHLIKPVLFFTALVGAIMALTVLVWRRDFWVGIEFTLKKLLFWRRSDNSALVPGTPVTIPYGIAIAAGCLVALYLGAG